MTRAVSRGRVVVPTGAALAERLHLDSRVTMGA
jgi:hypothetical protein